MSLHQGMGCLQNTDLENTDLENADLENADLGSRKPTERRRTSTNSVTKKNKNIVRKQFSVFYIFSKPKLPQFPMGPRENNFNVQINCACTGKFHHFKNFEKIF